MAMDRNEPTVKEDKDALIQRANKLLVKKGLEPLFHSFYLTKGELTDAIKKAKLMNDFTGKDQILLHFNRWRADAEKMRQFSDHIATHKFPTKAVAKAFIEATIREAWERVPEPSKKWVSKDRFVLNDWIIITAAGPYTLESIMESKPDKAYKLPAPYDYYAEQIMRYHWGMHPQINTRARGDKPMTEAEHDKYAPPCRAEELNQKREAQRGKRKIKEPAVTGRTQAEKPNKSDVPKRAKSADGVSLAAICAALRIDPKEARGALRKVNYPKPGSSWEWDKSDEAKVMKDVKAAIEKARKK